MLPCSLRPLLEFRYPYTDAPPHGCQIQDVTAVLPEVDRRAAAEHDSVTEALVVPAQGQDSHFAKAQRYVRDEFVGTHRVRLVKQRSACGGRVLMCAIGPVPQVRRAVVGEHVEADVSAAECGHAQTRLLFVSVVLTARSGFPDARGCSEAAHWRYALDLDAASCSICAFLRDVRRCNVKTVYRVVRRCWGSCG